MSLTSDIDRRIHEPIVNEWNIRSKSLVPQDTKEFLLGQNTALLIEIQKFMSSQSLDLNPKININIPSELPQDLIDSLNNTHRYLLEREHAALNTPAIEPLEFKSLSQFSLSEKLNERSWRPHLMGLMQSLTPAVDFINLIRLVDKGGVLIKTKIIGVNYHLTHIREKQLLLDFFLDLNPDISE